MDQTTLKRHLSYKKETGLFSWNDSRSGRRIKDQSVGWKAPDGYISICIDGNRYPAHRLAWLYVYGEWPADQLDHINRIRDDNRICNLREVNAQENGRNAKKWANNTSGATGVYRTKHNKWVARIWISGKGVYLGTYHNIKEAIFARKIAEAFYGFSPTHGQ